MSNSPLAAIHKEMESSKLIASQEEFAQDVRNSYRSLSDGLSIPMFAMEAEMHRKMASEIMGSDTPKGKEAALLVRTSDKKNFRVYMKADYWFSQRYLLSICRFLDNRKEGETVTFILGTKMYDYQTHMIGPIVSAILNCKATVNCVAAGYCSVPETMIWCFGKHRTMYRYGALSFSITDILKYCKEYGNYFNVFFAKAIEIGMLTKEEVEEIIETGKEKMILFNDYQELTKK